MNGSAISSDNWYKYFKELLCQPVNISENNLHICNQEITTHDTSCIDCEINSPIMINDIITYDMRKLLNQ